MVRQNEVIYIYFHQCILLLFYFIHYLYIFLLLIYFLHMNLQPKWTDDTKSLCFAGILERYLDKISPGQTRLFCKPATQGQMDTCTQLGWKNAQMSQKQPLRVNSIALLFKKGAKLLGVNNPDTFGGHALRAYFFEQIIQLTSGE